VDLIYLDPPFNSRADYNVLFAEKDGTRSSSQITAFEDTWEWNIDAEHAYQSVVEGGGRVAEAMRAFRTFLGNSDMMAYLAMMAPRLIELRRVLKVTGSIYLHCDPTASHYLKMLMDAIFGPQNFRNEIIWRRTGSHNKTLRYGPIHDVILFYSASDSHTWTFPKRPYMVGHVRENFIEDKQGYRTNYYGNVLTGSGLRGGESGLPWRGVNPSDKGRHWAVPKAIVEDSGEDMSSLSQHEKLERLLELGFIKFEEGAAWPIYERRLKETDGQFLPDIWAFQPYTNGTVFGTDSGIDEDVRWLSTRDQERLGYQTQKPEALLERIIRASSNEGNVVLDPFCGCGTAVAAAQTLKRRWIGIDITHLAIGLIKQRLQDRFDKPGKPGEPINAIRNTYEIHGEPTDLSGARKLAEDDKFQFEAWALSLVGARPAGQVRRGADKGIDGRLYFHDDTSGKSKQIILSVKGGHVEHSHIRDLGGVLDREQAEIGVLITLEPASKPMKTEAASAGFYKPASFEGQSFPRIQILTIEEILAGKGIEFQSMRDATYKQAPKAKAKKAENLTLDLG
jgi:site-specific DNA-methyltransferase (adenine-specific)